MPTAPALIVVGLPRSSSSFLAHVLSTLDDLWVFDDLYVVQKARALTLGPMSDDQLRFFVDRLAWETRAKITWQKGFGGPDLTLHDVDALEARFLAEHLGTAPRWFHVTEAWVGHVAAANHCSRWGYKTPQDFLHLDFLHEVWPTTRFVHLVRDPREVMQSYKNLVAAPGSDGDPRSYHPIAYALYWRMSQRRVRVAQQTPTLRIETVRFEDLTRNPDRVAARLAAFLDTTATRPVNVDRYNTSAPTGKNAAPRPRRRLTDTERWICEKLAAKKMIEAGYPPGPARPRLRDVPELLRVTLGFGCFHLQRAVTDR